MPVSLKFSSIELASWLAGLILAEVTTEILIREINLVATSRFCKIMRVMLYFINIVSQLQLNMISDFFGNCNILSNL